MTKGMLGIELTAPYEVGPLRISELSLGLTGIRFPIDLSGGVARFRHRRGALLRVAVEARTEDLGVWAVPRLRGLFAETAPEVAILSVEGALLVGLRAADVALGFEVVLAPIEGDLRLLPERARGIGLKVPPHAMAMRVLAALMMPYGRVVRGGIVVAGATAQVVRAVLPEAGARAPSVIGVRWEAPGALGSSGLGVPGIRLVASAGAAPPAMSDRALRALELSDLTGDADAAAYAGDLETARRLYLEILERAPRHPEASRRLAWIDATIGDRAEAALSTIVDAMPAAFAGILGGELLAAVGDRDGARVALAQAAEAEPFGALAALTWLRAAALSDALDLRLSALDHAVACAPSLTSARWARLEASLGTADMRRARADAEHLEAGARGPESRYAVLRRCAEAFLARGFAAEASVLFERALRYVPDDAAAVTGLARSLKASGQHRRSLDLFARAVALATNAGQKAYGAEIELARGLAEMALDRPAAVARVRTIAPGFPESIEARFLEGRWRAELGDLAGAALSFGRLRDAVEMGPPTDPDVAAAVAAMLVEAADIEERERSDAHSAQRNLGLALRLRPRDATIAATFRRVAGLVARGGVGGERVPVADAPRERDAEREHCARDTPPAPPAVAERPDEAPLGVPHEGDDPDKADDDTAEHNEAQDEQRAEELAARVRGNPSDHATAMELAAILKRLGRDLDLLALLSARMDEGGEAVRRELEPMRREVLLRLAGEAWEAGKASEAELYEMMANATSE